ncbi:uncharacterized protein LOC132164973 [Corylus avellana]|uniref:uncharacterized protein LOC132164973 n=1 Tax=Corylus avellana TaxID=13451 RepID=UPI00286BCF63|nr:uncharacterized protein LOC132164973 [Corylus avellana]
MGRSGGPIEHHSQMDGVVPLEECHLSVCIPHAFVTNNGKQFDCDSFRKWCSKLQIRNYFSSSEHPQANGQVEATNKTIFKILKKKLGENIPTEVGSGSIRIETFWPESNDEGIRLHLDLLQEKWDEAQVTMAEYQEKEARYFNQKVNHRSFKLGDLVMQKVTNTTKDPAMGKLATNCEGPYKVVRCRRAGAYHLEDGEGKALPRPWNAEHLKKYFV